MNQNLGRQFKVLDFQAAKMVKERTGRAAAIEKPMTPDSPELIAHENKAMELGNPVPQAPQKKSLVDKLLSPVDKLLGLE